MTSRLNTSRNCAQAWEAMPWVLQGNAPQQQRDWLTEHLAECAACHAEFEQQQRLRLALSLPTDIPLDPAVGLGRLMARLDQPEAVPAAAPSLGQRLLRPLVAAVLIQAIGIGALGARLWSERPTDLYRTHSDAVERAPHGAIRVVPDTGMTMASWNALLKAEHLKVVAGPNDVGAYTVVPTDESVSSRQVVTRLRTAHGIRFAEPAADTQ